MQVESEESSADSLSVFVSDKSIPLTFTNDKKFPWTIGEGYLQNGNVGNTNSASTLSFSYNCDKRTELSFDWACNEFSWHKLYLYIDGVLTNTTTNSSFTSPRYFIDKGSHVITFKDSIGNYTGDRYYRSGIRNICVRSILPLETIALTEKSQPLTFINESEYPWTTEDGYIQMETMDIGIVRQSSQRLLKLTNLRNFHFGARVTLMIIVITTISVLKSMARPIWVEKMVLD